MLIMVALLAGLGLRLVGLARVCLLRRRHFPPAANRSVFLLVVARRLLFAPGRLGGASLLLRGLFFMRLRVRVRLHLLLLLLLVIVVRRVHADRLELVLRVISLLQVVR